MILTDEILQKCLPNNDYISDWVISMNEHLPSYGINETPERLAAFISQCSHESAEFTRLIENLNYRWESLRRVFPKYFNEDLAKKYAHNQKAIANRVYANRMGNGPESSGDGWKFRGRGILQITGKNNYSRFAEYVGLDLEEVPDFLETFDGAIISACWYWDRNNLNKYSDEGDLEGLTKAINGGYNGLSDRIQKYNKIFRILSDN